MKKQPEDMTKEELINLREWMMKKIKYLNYLISEAK